MSKNKEIIDNFYNYDYKGVFKCVFEYKTDTDIKRFLNKINNLMKDKKMIVEIEFKQINI